MSLRKAILMLMLLAPIALLVVQSERRRAEQEKLDAPVVLGTIELKDVESLKIFHEGGSYRVARASTIPRLSTDGDPQRWVFSAPEGAPANQEVVDSVVNALISVRAENSIPVNDVDANQSVYGLDPPELIGILRGSFGKRVVSFGKQNPVSKRRYVQPEQDGKLYLVDNATFLEAAKAPTAVRAKYPLRFPREKVKSVLALPRDGEAIHIQRTSERNADTLEQEDRELASWVIRKGKTYFDADTDVVHRELGELLEVESIRYIDQAAHGLPYFGLLKPILTVRIELDAPVTQKESSSVVGGDDGVIIVQIGRGLDAEKGLAAGNRAYFLKITGQPWVYEFSRPFYMDWLQGFQHFQDRTPFDAMDPLHLRQIIAARGSASRSVLAKAPDKEEALSWEGADATLVENLLGALYPLRILSFVKTIEPEEIDGLAERFGITKDSLRVELKTSDDKKRIELRFGKKVSASGSQTSEDTAVPRFVLLTTTRSVEAEQEEMTFANLVVVSGKQVHALEAQGENLLGETAP